MMGEDVSVQEEGSAVMTVEPFRLSRIPQSPMVNVKFNSLHASSVGFPETATVRYDITMELGETQGNVHEGYVIPFSVRVSTKPSIASFGVEGEVRVSGPKEEVIGIKVGEALPEKPPKEDDVYD